MKQECLASWICEKYIRSEECKGSVGPDEKLGQICTGKHAYKYDLVSIRQWLVIRWRRAQGDLWHLR